MGIAQLDGLILTHDDNDHTGGRIIYIARYAGKLALILAGSNHPLLSTRFEHPALHGWTNLGMGTECTLKYYTRQRKVMQ